MRVLTLAELSFVAGGDYGGGGDDSGDIVVTGNPDTGGDDTGGDYDPGDYGNDGADDGSSAGGDSGNNQADATQLPKGYHASPMDPNHEHYMLKDGDSSGKLYLTPEYAAQAQDAYDKMTHSATVLGLGSTAAGVVVGTPIGGAIMGIILGSFGLADRPPNAPTQ